MLTNKIFDTFLAVLQQQMTRPPVSSIAEAHYFKQDLERARIEFEGILSEKLLMLSTEKQIELTSHILALFEKNNGLLLFQPAYLWHVDKLSHIELVWYREPNESSAVKTFRGECERRISTNLEDFLAPLQAFSETAKEANQFVRLVTNPDAIGVFDEIVLDYDEMDLHYEAARWIEEGLRAKAGCEAQENIRQHFEKLAGKEAAVRWIVSPERWYDAHRESQGLPPIQEPFQNSYEAWHFYFSDLRTAPVVSSVSLLDIPVKRLLIAERLPIDEVLSIPRSTLDKLLLDATMIEEDTTPGRYKAKPTAKPWQWANVRAALQFKLLMAEVNDETAAALFAETYKAVVKRGTMQQRPQNEVNSKNKTNRVKAFEEFCTRLLLPKSS